MSSNEIKSTSERLESIEEKLNRLLPDNSDIVVNQDTQLIIDRLDSIETHIENNHSKTISMNSKLRDEILISECKPTESVETEIEADPKFIRRMWTALSIGLSISGLLSAITFHFLTPAFPFVLGFFTTLMGFFIWFLADEFMFKGYSIGRIGNNAISLGLTTIAIAIMYSVGVTMGNSYISSRYAADNEKPQPNIEANSNASESRHSDSISGQQQPSATRSQGVILSVPASQGTAQSEQ